MIKYTCVLCGRATIETGRMAALLHEVAKCDCCYVCALRLVSEPTITLDLDELEEEGK